MESQSIELKVPRAIRSALNRLIIAGRNEIITLEEAARVVDGAERRSRLRQQAKRRAIFRRDLALALNALGGVPAQHASGMARLAVGARRIRRLLMGPHDGDAYALCARATERTATAYAKALKLTLPADVRFGVESQYDEIEWDRGELRRLRWGASLSPLPGGRAETKPERLDAASRNELADERALEDWSEDGGAGPGGRNVPVAHPRVAGMAH